MSKINSLIIRHWKTLLAFNLFIISLTILKIYFSPKVWMANGQLILPEVKGKLNANLGTLGSLDSGDTSFSAKVNPLLAQQSILTSNLIMQKLLDSDVEQEEFPTLKGYKQLFEAEIEEGSTTISLITMGSSPELAQERADKWIELYQQRLNKLRQENSEARMDFSQKELTKVQQELAQAQKELAQFEQSSGLVDSEAQTSGMIQLINQLSAAKYEAEVAAKSNERKALALGTRLNLTPSQAINSVKLSENQEYQAIREKLIEAEIELSQLQTTRTNADPQVRELRLKRDELKNQYQNYVRQEVNQAPIDRTLANNSGRTDLIQELILAESEAQAQNQEAEKLDNKIQQLRANLETIPANKTRLQQLQKEKDVAEGVYQGLIARFQQAKIDAFNAYAQIQVLEPPLAAPQPVEPNIMLVQLNAFLAAVVGSIALIIFREHRNPLLTNQDLQSYGLPNIGYIHDFKYFGNSLKNNEFWLNLISQSNTLIELDFQRLASAISLRPLENRRLLVTSAVSGEGKTTVTLGLSKALADLGFKVLMVDADFYKAELTHSLACLNLDNISEKPLEITTNLYLQPRTTWSQQASTAALVKQGKLEQHLGIFDLTDDYDYIIVDSSPVSVTSATALMATEISNVLYVIRQHFSERNSVCGSFEQLHQHNAKIFGLVVNGVTSHSRPYSQGYLEPAKSKI